MKRPFLLGLFLTTTFVMYSQEVYYQVTEYSFKEALSETLFAETKVGEGSAGSALDINVISKLVRDSKVIVLVNDADALLLMDINNEKECEVLNFKDIIRDSSSVVKPTKWPVVFDYQVGRYGVMTFEKLDDLGNNKELVDSIKKKCKIE